MGRRTNCCTKTGLVVLSGSYGCSVFKPSNKYTKSDRNTGSPLHRSEDPFGEGKQYLYVFTDGELSLEPCPISSLLPPRQVKEEPVHPPPSWASLEQAPRRQNVVACPVNRQKAAGHGCGPGWLAIPSCGSKVFQGWRTGCTQLPWESFAPVSRYQQFRHTWPQCQEGSQSCLHC